MDKNENKLTLLLLDTKFTIPFNFNAFPKVSDEIKKSFFFKGGEYYVQSQIRGEVLQEFLDSWVFERELQIRIDNIWEFHLLSQEFQLFSDIISNPVHKNVLCLSCLEYLAREKNNNDLNIDKLASERHIAQNLDHYIENHSKNIYKIPLTFLYNIFFHKERILYDHEKAYFFIVNFPNDESCFDHFVLLQSLDCNKLKRETVIDSFSKVDEHFGFLPCNSNLFMKKFGYIYTEQTNLISMQSRQIDQLKNENRNIKMINEQLRSQDEAKEEKAQYLGRVRMLEEQLSESERIISELKEQLSKEKEKVRQYEMNDEEELYKLDELERFTDSNNICYLLSNKAKVAKISKSPKAKGEVTVKTFVRYNNEKYKVIGICEEAFLDSPIKKLTFLEDSGVKSIGSSAFKKSALEELNIPASCILLNDNWCKGAENLKLVQVDINNQNICNENGFIMLKKRIRNKYKIENTNDILFVPCETGCEISIQSSIERIGNYSFANCEMIETIEANNSSLRMIDSYSFYNCINLKKIHVSGASRLTLGSHIFAGTSLSTLMIECKELIICKHCFSNCLSLQDINFKQIIKIVMASKAFKKCKNLEKIAIKKASEIQIGNECFYNLDKLKSLKLSSDSITFGDNFIKGCSSLTSLKIKSINNIIVQSNMFDDCKMLKDIKFDTLSRLKLCDGCLKQLKNIENIEIISNHFDTYGSFCFQNCSTLKKLILNLKKDICLPKEFLDGCKSLSTLQVTTLESIDIPKGSMNGLEKLQNVKLSGKKVIIDDDCFNNCDSLNKIEIIESEYIKICNNGFKNCNKFEIIELICKNNSENTPKIQLEEHCFKNAKSLKDITFTGGETSIRNNCLKDCISLDKISFVKAGKIAFSKEQFMNCPLSNIIIESNSSVNLDTNCFQGSKNLEIITISGKNVTLNDGCFQNCPSLKTIVFHPVSNVTLGSSVFLKCPQLTYINIETGSNLTIGESCFKGLNIAKVSLQSGGNIRIAKNSFQNCSFISSLEIPKAKEIVLESEAFSGCKNLEDIEIKSSKLTVGAWCFYCNASLKTIKIETEELNLFENCFSKLEKLATVELKCKDIITQQNCFCRCISLKNISLPDSEKVTFGHNSFDGCCSIDNITINAKLSFKACNYCFSGASKLGSITINSDNVTFENFCFYRCTLLQQVSCLSAKSFTYCNTSFYGASKSLKYNINNDANKKQIVTKSVINYPKIDI
ncbi:hypothetical protein M9Y10_029975 [Tritrichomonas musculus]|uniref:Uncharacterized protein n=1 Tax=Tritrichomonas musculus TaxID=1915356 RepID=A0ABR2KNJ7_9EUKA